MLKLKPVSRNAITFIREENAIFEENLDAKFLVGPITTPKFSNSVSRLNLNNRILHLLVSYIIRPFGSKHSTVSVEDMWFMYHIKRMTLIDLAHFIFKDMDSLTKRVRNNRVHGMAISQMLGQWKVDISIDKPIMSNEVKFLDKGNLGRIGFKYDATKNGWVKEERAQEEAQVNQSMLNALPP